MGQCAQTRSNYIDCGYCLQKELPKKKRHYRKCVFFFPQLALFGQFWWSSLKRLFHHFRFYFVWVLLKRLCWYPALHLLASLSFLLCVLLLVFHRWQRHPAPLNKIKPNRKHSKEINSGLQCLGHPFGLTAAAKTRCLQLFYTVRQPAEWIRICELFLSITTRWEWNWQSEVRRLCKDVLSVRCSVLILCWYSYLVFL